MAAGGGVNNLHLAHLHIRAYLRHDIALRYPPIRYPCPLLGGRHYITLLGLLRGPTKVKPTYIIVCKI